MTSTAPAQPTPTAPAAEPVYLMGRDTAEARRLIQQARIYQPATRWLLQRAGLRPGMTVLDVGSGSGDVALLARELVGPDGAVVGVDQNPEILDLARARTAAAGYDNVRFMAGDVRELALDQPVDAVVGRLVLMYIPDREATLAALLELLRPGGIVAFQEMDFVAGTVYSHPSLPGLEPVWPWMVAAARAARLETAMGLRLPSLFRAAGVVDTQQQLTAQLGYGPEDDMYEFVAASLRSMLPLIVATGVASAAEVDIETLADRLRTSALAADAVVKAPDLVGAWGHRP